MGYKRRLAENCGPYISGAPTYALRVDAVWVGLGILVLVLTLLEVFLTALNYDEAGFFAGRLASWQWAITRSFTRRVARRWRPVVLRQVTGLQVIVTVGAWIGGTILGYGLIYFGSMEDKNFLYSGQHADFFGAIYFSAAQLATVGTSQLTPNTDVLSRPPSDRRRGLLRRDSTSRSSPDRSGAPKHRHHPLGVPGCGGGEGRFLPPGRTLP